jgi:hypothetical protein
MEEFATRLNETMKRVQQELQPAMERVGAELQRAMEEFQKEHHAPVDLDKRPTRGRRARTTSPKPDRPSGKKRPRRRPPGSAAAPVKPKPKPKPLVDGAEAPLD